MRAFLTGGNGFVGRWLRSHLESCGDEVFELSEGIDVAEAGALDAELVASRPEVVFHLAALTHVGRSWDSPEATFRVNAIGTLHLLEAARVLPSPPRVVLVSSAEVYGSGEGSPLGEDAPLRPSSPYAASKVAAEYLGVQEHLGRGLDVVRVRPFNHVGPGQDPAFVVSALAERVARAEAAGGDAVPVGNLSAARDFTDVRDVVRAYRLLALEGQPGAVYNVCSGRAVEISRIAELLVAASRRPMRLVEDPSLLRPVDVPLLLGDCSRLVALTGWRPQISIEQTLAEVLEEARSRLVSR